MRRKETSWRMSLTLPKELEEEIVALRKTDKYCRMSYAEIIRTLIEAGLSEKKPT
jgi:Arc/MetJ-type ribon-helix-helix transcriptional regulator